MVSSMTVCIYRMPDQVSMRRCLMSPVSRTAVLSFMFVPAWDSRHGSRLGSSLGCLSSSGLVQWTLESPAAVAGQCQEHGELGRYPAGTRTCHQQYGAQLAVSAVSVARPGNNDHRPLRLAQRKTVMNSRAFTQRLKPSATCWTSGDNAVSAQRQCCASLCHKVRRCGRSADYQVKRLRTPLHLYRRKTRCFKHRKYQNLWMNNKVRSD